MSAVYVYVFDTLADWEIGHTLAHLSTPRYGSARVEVRLTAKSLAPIITMGGLTLHPHELLDDIHEPALFMLPGGVTWDTDPKVHELAANRARELLVAGMPVAAICGATAGLARAGVLDDREHTSNAATYLAMTGYHGADYYREAPAVTDRGLITASSIAPVDFAAHIFDVLGLYSPEVLAAWHGLFTTGDPRHFGVLMAASGT